MHLELPSGASSQCTQGRSSVDPLPPPPEEGSEAHKADLADLHRIIAARTPERLAQAKWDDEHEDPSAYYATIGGGFDLKTLPATAALLAVVTVSWASVAPPTGASPAPLFTTLIFL